MKHYKLFNILIICSMVFASCEKAIMNGDVEYSPKSNFNYLWSQVNEKYSYFDVKNINWDSVYKVYTPLINEEMLETELFNTLFDMLCILKDGHVNLMSSFNVSRYSITNNAPENFNWRLIKDYYLEPGPLNHLNVTEHYYVTGALRHQIFHFDSEDIGYIYYGAFSEPIEDYDIEFILSRMSKTKGLIIDVRNNGGGSPNNIFQILNKLTIEKRYIYGSRIKTGKSHNEFSEVTKVYSTPKGKNLYTKPVAILTNRNCYSATSFFAAACKSYPNIVQVGDTTGGGAGAPHGGQLPNGWYYRFSVTQSGYPSGDTLYDFEKGVPPDVYINIDNTNTEYDEIIDHAILLLRNK